MKKFFTSLSALALTVGTSVVSFAQESASDTQIEEVIDFSGYIESAITVLGGIVGVAVGGFFAFFLVRKGIQFVRAYLKA